MVLIERGSDPAAIEHEKRVLAAVDDRGKKDLEGRVKARMHCCTKKAR